MFLENNRCTFVHPNTYVAPSMAVTEPLAAEGMGTPPNTLSSSFGRTYRWPSSRLLLITGVGSATNSSKWGRSSPSAWPGSKATAGSVRRSLRPIRDVATPRGPSAIRRRTTAEVPVASEATPTRSMSGTSPSF